MLLTPVSPFGTDWGLFWHLSVWSLIPLTIISDEIPAAEITKIFVHPGTNNSDILVENKVALSTIPGSERMFVENGVALSMILGR